MAVIRVQEFGGIIPKLDPKRLPDNCAVEAVNVDLQGRGIIPLNATLFKRDDEINTTPASIAQWPTACLKMIGMTAAGYVSFSPASGNYVIAAGDELVYAVYLPAGTTAAGQGCIDLHFTSGATLGDIGDRNAIGSLAGDITARAQGVWYVREITLASVVGLTVDEVRFYNNNASVTPLTGFFGVAYIRTTPHIGVAPKCVLWDADAQQSLKAISSTTNIQFIEQTSIDEDDATVISVVSPVTIDQSIVTAPAGFSGKPRNKMLSVETQAIPGQNTIVGWSNHDRFAPYDLELNNGNFSIYPQNGWWLLNSAGAGWVAVTKPTAAMGLSVTGGTGQKITRSYVFTNVSEDGLESGPSPAVTVSGFRSGTWALTGITSYLGTDGFNAIRNPMKKRIYRTPEGSAVYRFVAEINAATTTANDTALDSVLGEALSSLSYQDPPKITGISPWINGMIAGLVDTTQVAVCQPFQYHAWPIAYRYTIPYVGVTVRSFGDRIVALTLNKPQIFTGRTPAELIRTELESGEACIGVKGVLNGDYGVIYPGVTGWGLIDYNGYENITREFMLPESYEAIVGKNTVALFDNRKLVWITQGATIGYSFEFGAKERSLTKFEVPDPIYAMSYYGARKTRWIAYTSGGTTLNFGKLWANTSQRLKWTWKSKPVRLSKPTRLKVAQIDSNEWDSLSASMKAREAAYKTGGGGSPYSITITGLTQAEPWCYLKVWCEADKGADAVLVFDDFVVSDRPVRLQRRMKSDCWQFEIRGNMAISQIALAELEKELNSE